MTLPDTHTEIAALTHQQCLSLLKEDLCDVWGCMNFHREKAGLEPLNYGEFHRIWSVATAIQMEKSNSPYLLCDLMGPSANLSVKEKSAVKYASGHLAVGLNATIEGALRVIKSLRAKETRPYSLERFDTFIKYCEDHGYEC